MRGICRSQLHAVGSALRLGVAVGIALPMFAGEPVRFTDSPDAGPRRSPTEQQRSLVGEAGRTGPSSPERALTGPNVTMPPPYIAAPALTQKEREELERKRNWIFQTTDSLTGGGATAEDAFGVEAYRLEKEWTGNRRTSNSMTRFIERGPVTREVHREESEDEQESTSGKRNSDESGRSGRRAPGWDVLSVGPGRPETTVPGLDRRQEMVGPGLVSSGSESGSLSGRNAAQRVSLRPRFGGNSPTESTVSGAERQLRGGDRLTARDFALTSDSGHQPKSEAGANDPVNLFPDLTRQALNPVSPGAVPTGIAATRPPGFLGPEIGRPATRFQSRFAEGVRGGLGESFTAERSVEADTAPASKVFKSRVALEMPARRF